MMLYRPICKPGMYISLIPFQLKNVPKIGGGPESMFFRAPGFPGFPPAPIPGGPTAPTHRLPTSSAAAAAPSLGIPQPPPPGAAPLPPSVDPLRGSHPPSTMASATPASSATSTATSNGPKVRLVSFFKSFLFPNSTYSISFYFITCLIFPFFQKTGKWNAMHVRIAWEIYNHQQKQKSDKGGTKSSSKSSALSSSLPTSSSSKPPTTTANPTNR